MGLYTQNVLPWLVDRAMRGSDLEAWRIRAVPLAEGAVLEVGVGSGYNLPHYGPNVTRIVGVDPSPRLLELAQARHGRPLSGGAPRPSVELVCADAESLPFEAAAFDTVVSTWTMCSIADLGAALTEVRRVLRPSGRLVFVEHGLSDRPRVQWLQRLLTPLWRRCSGGCCLDRRIDALVADAGFSFDALTLEHQSIVSRLYFGVARPR